jgi:hypothetical protein
MSTQTESHSPVTAKPRSRAAIWLTTVAAAVLLPVIIWVLTVVVAGHEMVANSFGQPVDIVLPSVVAGGLIPSVAGLGVASFVRRFAHARRIWAIIGMVALIASLQSPLGGTSPATVLVLEAMHFVVGAVVITGGHLLLDKR